MAPNTDKELTLHEQRIRDTNRKCHNCDYKNYDDKALATHIMTGAIPAMIAQTIYRCPGCQGTVCSDKAFEKHIKEKCDAYKALNSNHTTAEAKKAAIRPHPTSAQHEYSAILQIYNTQGYAAADTYLNNNFRTMYPSGRRTASYSLPTTGSSSLNAPIPMLTTNTNLANSIGPASSPSYHQSSINRRHSSPTGLGSASASFPSGIFNAAEVPPNNRPKAPTDVPASHSTNTTAMPDTSGQVQQRTGCSPLREFDELLTKTDRAPLPLCTPPVEDYAPRQYDGHALTPGQAGSSSFDIYNAFSYSSDLDSGLSPATRTVRIDIQIGDDQPDALLRINHPKAGTVEDNKGVVHNFTE
ncbi:hypothetical protein LTR37_016370 [Vermiconidia calcicola]|uniref:Uncharacterized protein n=1 Tax=Vermiconidia calcicola TaxID=1690605 RepID=A0ACC3MN69_9PEZI|nr:hypothetical protein LTR37_016370 [Vermiconidia calcicola]